MTGSKLSYTINEKQQPILKCALPNNMKTKNNIKIVLITYNIGLDVYEYAFINNKRIPEKQIIKQINNVYAEDLIPYFEAETGLYCYL